MANKPPIISTACHGIGPKFFLSLIWQKIMAQFFINYPGSHHWQGVLRFATQISPLLNWLLLLNVHSIAAETCSNCLTTVKQVFFHYQKGSLVDHQAYKPYTLVVLDPLDVIFLDNGLYMLERDKYFTSQFDPVWPNLWKIKQFQLYFEKFGYLIKIFWNFVFFFYKFGPL